MWALPVLRLGDEEKVLVWVDKPNIKVGYRKRGPRERGAARHAESATEMVMRGSQIAAVARRIFYMWGLAPKASRPERIGAPEPVQDRMVGQSFPVKFTLEQLDVEFFSGSSTEDRLAEEGSRQPVFSN
jgi:hypothetical protein